MELIYQEVFPDSKSTPFISFLDENLLVSAAGNLVSVYQIEQKTASDYGCQKTRALKTPKKNQRITSKVTKLMSSESYQQFYAICNQKSVFCWTLGQNMETNVQLNVDLNCCEVFKSENDYRALDIFNLQNRILICHTNGVLSVIDGSSDIQEKFQILDGDVTCQILEMTHCRLCEVYDNTVLVSFYLITVFSQSCQSSNERKDQSEFKSFCYVVKLDPRNLSKSQIATKIVINGKVATISAVPKVDLTNSNSKMVVCLKNGHSKVYNFASGVEISSYPFSIRSIIDNNDSLAYSQNELFYWHEPLNEVLFSKNHVYDMNQIESSSMFTAFFAHVSDPSDNNAIRKRTFLLYSHPGKEHISSLSDLITLNSNLKAPLSEKSEIDKFFKSLCDLLNGTVEHQDFESHWAICDQKTTINSLRLLEKEQVLKLFHLCATVYVSQDLSLQLRATILRLSEWVLTAHRDLLVNMLSLGRQSSLGSDFTKFYLKISHDCDRFDAIDDFLKSYDCMLEAARNDTSNNSHFFITYIDV